MKQLIFRSRRFFIAFGVFVAMAILVTTQPASPFRGHLSPPNMVGVVATFAVLVGCLRFFPALTLFAGLISLPMLVLPDGASWVTIVLLPLGMMVPYLLAEIWVKKRGMTFGSEAHYTMHGTPRQAWEAFETFRTPPTASTPSRFDESRHSDGSIRKWTAEYGPETMRQALEFSTLEYAPYNHQAYMFKQELHRAGKMVQPIFQSEVALWFREEQNGKTVVQLRSQTKSHSFYLFLQSYLFDHNGSMMDTIAAQITGKPDLSMVARLRKNGAKSASEPA